MCRMRCVPATLLLMFCVATAASAATAATAATAAGPTGLSSSTAPVDGPYALHSPQLLVPDETAGSGISPEVAVRLSIDDRGKVSAVDVKSITPASEYDDAFRKTVVDTLLTWRFAPAKKDGRPVPSSLEWRVRFPVHASTTGHLEVTAPIAGSDLEDRRAAILALPVSARLKLLDSEGRSAIARLDATKKSEFSSARFVVRSDSDEPKVAGVIANNLEAIFNVLAAELLPGVELQAERYKILVFAFRSSSEYHAFASSYPWSENSDGYYSASGLIAFDLEHSTNDDVLSILLHEATHAFLDRHVVRPGIALPRWLGEGFAEYVGNSAIQKGRLKPGKTFVHKYAFQSDQVASYQTGAGFNLDAAKTALRKGQGLSLKDLLVASPEIFYGDRARLYYASAWLLVHYLRDGTPDSATTRFPQLLLYLAEGYPQVAAFHALYGPTGEADAAFRSYVKDF
ncbi:MAG: energy transducer TonB [Thermoanaerobaculia bacterium]